MMLVLFLLLDQNDLPVLWEFFRHWPTVESALASTWQQVFKRLESFGVSEELAKTLVRFSGSCFAMTACNICALHLNGAR